MTSAFLLTLEANLIPQMPLELREGELQFVFIQRTFKH